MMNKRNQWIMAGCLLGLVASSDLVAHWSQDDGQRRLSI